MKKLYAPWRAQYVKKEGKPEGCIFCTKPQEAHDEQNFILKRFATCYALLNTYPYNAGHLMVVPTRHCAELSELTAPERAELTEATNTAIVAMHHAFSPDGFNVGINLGSTAGAGIPGHLHIHIVPRWKGDTNFMPVIADTKHISLDLTTIYKQLKTAFEKQQD